MSEIVETHWMGDMAFESQIDQFTINLDASPEHGGLNHGPRPKPLLLSSLAGCTGMDIVSIVRKKRVDLKKFDIRIEAEMTDTHPKYYHKIHLIFTFYGKDFEGNDALLSKITRAVELSSENYCGVSAMLKKSSEITYEIRIRNI